MCCHLQLCSFTRGLCWLDLIVSQMLDQAPTIYRQEAMVCHDDGLCVHMLWV
jgi:hypothetical protein